MSIGGLTLATVLLLPPPFDLISPCPGLLAHSLAAWRPCISATTTGTDADAETKLPPTTHEIDVPAHPPLPPITTRRVRVLESGSATLQLRERKRELEDTQAFENTQTHEHALSVSSSSSSSSESESPSEMRAEKQGVGGSGAANANANAVAHSQSHAGKDEQGLGERAEGGEDIGIDDDGAPDSSPHHA